MRNHRPRSRRSEMCVCALCRFYQSSLCLALVCAVLLAACGKSAAKGPGTPQVSPTPVIPKMTHALTIYRGHHGPVIGASWSPDSTRIASCGNDGTIQVWDAHSGQAIWSIHLARYTFAVAWSPDGKTVAGGASTGSVILLNAANGQTLATLTNQTSFIEGLAWSPDGKFLASGSQDNTVDVWNVAAGKLLLTYQEHTQAVQRVAWSPDGLRIASASYDGTVQVWQAKTGQLLLTYKGHGTPVWAVAWSPDSTFVVSGTGSAGVNASVTSHNSVKIWSARRGQTVLTYSGINDSTQTYALAWSPDGLRIAAGNDDNLVRIWDARSGRTLLEYAGHTGSIFTVAWSPDSNLVASASDDGTVQVWNPTG